MSWQGRDPRCHGLGARFRDHRPGRPSGVNVTTLSAGRPHRCRRPNCTASPEESLTVVVAASGRVVLRERPTQAETWPTGRSVTVRRWRCQRPGDDSDQPHEPCADADPHHGARSGVGGHEDGGGDADDEDERDETEGQSDGSTHATIVAGIRVVRQGRGKVAPTRRRHRRSRGHSPVGSFSRSVQQSFTGRSLQPPA